MQLLAVELMGVAWVLGVHAAGVVCSWLYSAGGGCEYLYVCSPECVVKGSQQLLSCCSAAMG